MVANAKNWSKIKKNLIYELLPKIDYFCHQYYSNVCSVCNCSDHLGLHELLTPHDVEVVTLLYTLTYLQCPGVCSVIPVSESPHDLCSVPCVLYKINCALALFSQAVFRINISCFVMDLCVALGYFTNNVVKLKFGCEKLNGV